MDNTFVTQMKQALEAEQAELKAELEAISSPDTGDHAIGRRAPKFPEYGPDNYGENTNAPQEVNDFLTNADTTIVLEKKLEDIEAALQRITAGTYGTCVVCGKQIDEERLKANPAADKCMQCA